MRHRPPGWILHGVLVVFALIALAGMSTPAGDFSVLFLAAVGLFLTGIVWVIRLVTYLVAHAKHCASGNAHWFLVAPFGLGAMILLASFNVPLHLRFAQARGSFEHAVDHPEDRATGRYGTYEVVAIDTYGRSVVFYESTGAFFDDAGFAYLPDGPSVIPSSPIFENPQFHHLTGDWYTWTASW